MVKPEKLPVAMTEMANRLFDMTTDPGELRNMADQLSGWAEDVRLLVETSERRRLTIGRIREANVYNAAIISGLMIEEPYDG